MKTLLLSVVVAFGLAASIAPVAAQTTSTTMPPVRSIPVTPAQPVTPAPAPAPTPTTAPKVQASTDTAAPPMAVTGISADKLVPFGLLLIGLGAALTNAARRYGRTRYNFL